MKTSESVVHPISPEHPLVEWDEVEYKLYKNEPAVVIGILKDGRAHIRDKHQPFGWAGYVPQSALTRISHAPTPEPAHDGEYSLTLEEEAECDRIAKERDIAAQKADLLEEADRVNPRLMQATDEQIEDERERRANFPERRIAAIKKEMLARYGEAWFKMMLKDFENQVRIHTRKCILAEQEGGSHE